ncbi:NAD-dependent epimerase/dehydratase family protein [Candidatus Gottesmanbacteria bacterium]|nr:NAD-dependent epimerase/dehydratase family protein [Candidatus Gottesmanbacteria bacterium]
MTGGAGFIGSHLVEMLLKENKQVICFDNLSSGKKEWIKPHLRNRNFIFHKADLLDLDKLKKSLKGSDLVWHLAANTDIPNGFFKTDMDLKNCVIGTRNVLEGMRLSGVKQIIFSSTGAIYGETGKIPFSESNGPLLPISLYAAGKLSSESFISAYCYLFGLNAWMFRFGNVLGARMGHGVIHDFQVKLRKNQKQLEILGDGNQAKNYFLVEECIGGMDFVYKHADLAKQPCDIFNLGTDSRTGVVEIADIICQEMKLQGVKYKFTGGKRGWPGDQPQVFLSVAKVKKLGWYPTHSSTEAVRIATRRMLGLEKFAYEG